MENKVAYLTNANIHIQNPGIDQHINLFLTPRLVSETMVPPPLARNSNAACVIPLRRSFSCSGSKGWATAVLWVSAFPGEPSPAAL